MLQNVILVEVYVKKILLHTDSWKRKMYLQSLFRDTWTLHQNLAGGLIPRMGCSLKCKECSRVQRVSGGFLCIGTGEVQGGKLKVGLSGGFLAVLKLNFPLCSSHNPLCFIW